MIRMLIITTLTVLAVGTFAADVTSRLTTFTVLAAGTEAAEVPSRTGVVETRIGDCWLGVDNGYCRAERYRAAGPNELSIRRFWSVLGLEYDDGIVGDFARVYPGQWFYVHLYPAQAASPRHRLTILLVPLWMLFMLFAAYPLVAFARGPLRRWRRRKRGGSLNCGYDLTGNGGICPECGKGV